MRVILMVLVAVVGIPVCASGIELVLTQWDPGTGPLSTSLIVQADNNLCCGGQSMVFEPSAIPFNDSHFANSGGVTAETSYQFSGPEIEIGPIAHFRSRRSSTASNGVVYFSIDQDGAYSLRGNYALSGGRDIELRASVWDLTEGALLFENRQVSFQTDDQAFVLGQAQGDSINVRAGARDRMIEGGHIYRLTYRASIASTEAGDGDASATGGILVTVLPEPLCGLTAGVGALIVVARARRRM